MAVFHQTTPVKWWGLYCQYALTQTEYHLWRRAALCKTLQSCRVSANQVVHLALCLEEAESRRSTTAGASKQTRGWIRRNAANGTRCTISRVLKIHVSHLRTSWNARKCSWAEWNQILCFMLLILHIFQHYYLFVLMELVK